MLKIACIGGKRLSLDRAVYGPLHVTAPLAGATLSRSATNVITWTNDYSNPGLSAVRIEFSTQLCHPPTIWRRHGRSAPAHSPVRRGHAGAHHRGADQDHADEGEFPRGVGPLHGGGLSARMTSASRSTAA